MAHLPIYFNIMKIELIKYSRAANSVYLICTESPAKIWVTLMDGSKYAVKSFSENTAGPYRFVTFSTEHTNFENNPGAPMDFSGITGLTVERFGKEYIGFAYDSDKLLLSKMDLFTMKKEEYPDGEFEKYISRLVFMESLLKSLSLKGGSYDDARVVYLEIMRLCEFLKTYRHYNDRI